MGHWHLKVEQTKKGEPLTSKGDPKYIVMMYYDVLWNFGRARQGAYILTHAQVIVLCKALSQPRNGPTPIPQVPI